MLIEDGLNMTTTYGTVKKTDDGSRIEEDIDQKTSNSGQRQRGKSQGGNSSNQDAPRVYRDDSFAVETTRIPRKRKSKHDQDAEASQLKQENKNDVHLIMQYS